MVAVVFGTGVTARKQTEQRYMMKFDVVAAALFMACLCAVAHCRAGPSTYDDVQHRSLLASAPKAAFVKANVVNSFEACPVKKPTKWDEKAFDASLDPFVEIMGTLALEADESEDEDSYVCEEALLDMSTCLADDNPLLGDKALADITSAGTTDGCCLASCAESITAAVKNSCFDKLVKLLCNDKAAAKSKDGIFNLATRCTGLTPKCPSADAGKAATAGAKADGKADSKSDGKADSKGTAKADAKPDAKPDAKAGGKPDAKADSKAPPTSQQADKKP